MEDVDSHHESATVGKWQSLIGQLVLHLEGERDRADCNKKNLRTPPGKVEVFTFVEITPGLIDLGGRR